MLTKLPNCWNPIPSHSCHSWSSGVKIDGEYLWPLSHAEFKSFGLKGRPSSCHIWHCWTSTKQLHAQHSSSTSHPCGSQVQQECGNVLVCPVGLLIPPEIQEASFRAWLCSFSHADPGVGTVPDDFSINKEPLSPRIHEVGKHLQDH